MIFSSSAISSLHNRTKMKQKA